VLQCYSNAGTGTSAGSEKYSESGALAFGGGGVRMSGVESVFSGGATPEGINGVPGMSGAHYSGATTPEGMGHGGTVPGGVFSGVATPEGMDLEFAPAVHSPAVHLPAVAGQVAADPAAVSTEGMVGPPAGTGITPSHSHNNTHTQLDVTARVTGPGDAAQTALFGVGDTTVQRGVSEENGDGSRDSSGHPSGGLFGEQANWGLPFRFPSRPRNPNPGIHWNTGTHWYPGKQGWGCPF